MNFTEDQKTRAEELLQSLHNLFRPLVEAVVRPIVEAELKNPPSLGEEEIQGLMRLYKAARAYEGPSAKAIDPKQVEGELRHPASSSPTEIEEDVALGVDEDTATLIRYWLTVLTLCAANIVSGQGKTINAAKLDDAMLPLMPVGIAQAFGQCFVRTWLNAAAAHDILRAVRRSLPAGQILPEAAVELLALLYDVTVV